MKAAGPTDHIESVEEVKTRTVVRAAKTIAVILTPFEVF